MPRPRLVLSLLLLAAIVGLVTLAVTGFRSGEHRGTVTVSRCAYLRDELHGKLYSCAGSFAADGGGFSVPYVTFDNLGRLDPGTRVAATLSGPDDTTASLVSESWWRLVITLGGAAAAAALLVSLWWRRWNRMERNGTPPR
jgi:hypothetical protein